MTCFHSVRTKSSPTFQSVESKLEIDLPRLLSARLGKVLIIAIRTTPATNSTNSSMNPTNIDPSPSFFLLNRIKLFRYRP
jgi:hypothetical protein